MGSFTEIINVDFAMQPKKKKKKKGTGKAVPKLKGSKDIRSFIQKLYCQKDTFM